MYKKCLLFFYMWIMNQYSTLEEMENFRNKKYRKIIITFLAIFILILTISYGYGKETREVDLIVRSINLHHSAADFPLRLRGIAHEFHHDYPHQIGLIGMQELERGTMNNCLRGKSYNNGAKCLAAELISLYGQKAEARIFEKNWLQQHAEVSGIIVDDNWKIIENKSWSIGYNRILLEVFLEHKTKGYRLRFYNTHFSSNTNVKWFEKIWYGYNSTKDKGQERRSRQASKVFEIVRERAKPGELPPIVVGDFNSGRNFVTGEAEVSVRKMEEHFWRPIDNFRKFCSDYTVIDNIYIGKKESFPDSQGYFKLIKWHRIRMHKKPVSVDGRRIDELTDHNAEGFSFNILIKPNKSIQRERPS